jgi:hypothetical protein
VTPVHHQPEAQHPKTFQLSTSRRPITPSLPPKADIARQQFDVRFVPLAGICSLQHIGSKFLNGTRLVGISLVKSVPRNSAK